jgi:hypothetical protein
VQIARKITRETGKQLGKERELVLIGTGGGMMHDIQMMAMGFNLYHEVSLDEARKLAIYAAEKYLNNINQNNEVRPYLHDDPFTVKNIEIRIWILKPDRSYVPSGEIKCVSVLDGMVSYITEDLGYYNPLLEEAYEEALEIVNNNRSTLPEAS